MLRATAVDLAAERAAHAATREQLAEALAALASARADLDVDPLTGLYTRRWLTAVWGSSRPPGLLLLDLDGFKAVNDRYGHAAGDEVLATTGRRLAAQDRSTAVRLHGDEFVVLLHDRADAGPRHIAAAAAWVAGLVAAPVALAGERLVTVTASAGAVMVTADDQLAEVLARADLAMYAAKRSSGRPVVWTANLEPPAGAVCARRGVRDARRGDGSSAA